MNNIYFFVLIQLCSIIYSNAQTKKEKKYENFKEFYKTAELHSYSNIAEEQQDSVIKYCNKAFEVYGKHLDKDFYGIYSQAYSIRGIAYFLKGDNKKAIEDFNKSNNIDNKHDIFNSNTYYWRGLAYKNNGQYDKSILDLSDAIKKDENVNYFFKRYEVFKLNGNIDKAIDDITKAIELDNENYYYYILRAQLYDEYKFDKSKALLDFNKAIEIDNTNFSLNERGLFYIKHKEDDKAISDFTLGIEIGIDKFIHRNRGVAYSRKGEYELALSDFNEALQLDSNYLDAMLERAKHYRLKLYDSKLVHGEIDKILSIDPLYTNAILLKADMKNDIGNYKESLSLLKFGLENSKEKHTEFIFKDHIFHQLVLMEDFSEAINYYSDADRDFLLRFPDIYQKRNVFFNTIKILASEKPSYANALLELNKIQSETESYLLLKGYILEKLDIMLEAINTYKKVLEKNKNLLIIIEKLTKLENAK